MQTYIYKATQHSSIHRYNIVLKLTLKCKAFIWLPIFFLKNVRFTAYRY